MTREERAAGWLEIVQKQAESGMSAAAFCREHHVNLQRFYFWRRRFSPKAVPEETTTKGFLELIPASDRQESGIRIDLGNGVHIEVHPGFDPLTLRQAVEALSGAEHNPCLP